MDLADMLMIAGLCVIAGSAAFLLWYALNAARRARGQDLRFMGDHPGAQLDLFMGTLWTGALLIQISNLLYHVGPGGTFGLRGLGVTAFAAVVFICGMFAGRLLLRLEMRRYKEKREEMKRAAQS